MINNGGDMERAVAARQTQVGGDWFFWIAGFSVVNSLIAVVGANLHFVIGLGLTELFDAAAPAGTTGKVIGFVLSLLAAGVYALFGLFARKGAQWAFLTGMILYALDALLLLLVKDWLSVAFHAYALFRIFQGFQGAQRLAALRSQPTIYPGGPPPGSTPGVWPPPPSV